MSHPSSNLVVVLSDESMLLMLLSTSVSVTFVSVVAADLCNGVSVETSASVFDSAFDSPYGWESELSTEQLSSIVFVGFPTSVVFPRLDCCLRTVVVIGRALGAAVAIIALF